MTILGLVRAVFALRFCSAVHDSTAYCNQIKLEILLSPISKRDHWIFGSIFLTNQSRNITNLRISTIVSKSNSSSSFVLLSSIFSSAIKTVPYHTYNILTEISAFFATHTIVISNWMALNIVPFFDTVISKPKLSHRRSLYISYVFLLENFYLIF